MKQVRTSAALLLAMTILCGIVYPLTMTGIAHVVFPGKAHGSLITAKGIVIGSGFIGQEFSGPRYFHGRPSASRYDAVRSGGTNFGPTSRKFIDDAAANVARVRKDNSLPDDMKIPSDLVLASGSGLDPHISVASAMLQAGRIAAARRIEKSIIMDLVARTAECRYGEFSGDPYVNVLGLNMALDDIK